MSKQQWPQFSFCGHTYSLSPQPLESATEKQNIFIAPAIKNIQVTIHSYAKPYIKVNKDLN